MGAKAETREVELPTWKEMNDSLTIRYQILHSFTQRNRKLNEKKFKAYSTRVTAPAENNCITCKQVRPLSPTFLRMSGEKRIASVKRYNKHCLSYLASSQKVENCASIVHATSGSNKLHQRASDSSHRSDPLPEDDSNCRNHNHNVQMQLFSSPQPRHHNNRHEALDIQPPTTN